LVWKIHSGAEIHRATSLKTQPDTGKTGDGADTQPFIKFDIIQASPPKTLPGTQVTAEQEYVSMGSRNRTVLCEHICRNKSNWCGKQRGEGQIILSHPAVAEFFKNFVV